MKTAIVLSGGGAKGAYQIGVWKALRKLHIKYQIITGTSVGALNGILMVQNSYRDAKKIWENISYSDIYSNGKFSKNTKNELDIYKEYADNLIANGGMDIKSLEKLFGEHISISKVRKSSIDYGIVTVNLTSLKPEELTKKELLNSNSLKDYVLASSSCFPAIKIKEIKGEKFVDGGYYDNLPINLAIRLGAKKIIAVDLQAPGIKKNIVNKDVQIIKITPHNKIVSFLVFDKYLSRSAINFGYNDTMKAFDKYEGNKYTFNKGNLYKNYIKNKNIMSLKLSAISSSNKKIFDLLSSLEGISEIIDHKEFYQKYNDIIEYAGEIFEINEENIYSIKNYNKLIINNFESLKNNNDTLINKTNKKDIVIYIYNLINQKELNIHKIIKAITLFKEEFLVAIYIDSIKK